MPSSVPALPPADLPGGIGRAEGAGGRELALAALRRRIARIEGDSALRLELPASRQGAPAPAARQLGKAARPVRPLGMAAADRALSGGFPAEGLTEIHLDETRSAGTGAGFALALAVLFDAGPARPALWAGDGFAFGEAGMPYLPGLAGFGLDPAGLFVVRTRRLEEAIWVGEEAAASGALGLAILEVRGNPAGLALEGTRRLHLRASGAGVPFVLLRHNARAEATAAPLRLRIRPGPASPVPDLADRTRLIGHPVFDVTVEKSRDGRSQRFLLEWNPHDRRFAPLRAPGAEPLPGTLAPQIADRPDPARTARPVVALRRASR